MMKQKNVLNVLVALAILLSVLAVSLVSSTPVFASDQIHWEDLTTAIKHNKTHKKFFLLDFYSAACHYCQLMDRNVYSKKDVINYLNSHFHPVRVNIYSSKRILYFNGKYTTGAKLMSKFHLTGPPTEIFFSPAYKKIFILPGYWGKKDLLLVARWIATGKYKVESLRKFSNS